MSDILKTDYSKTFDEQRKHLIEQSYYKYGPARRNFATGNVDAVGCIEKCLAKFKETGNIRRVRCLYRPQEKTWL